MAAKWIDSLSSRFSRLFSQFSRIYVFRLTFLILLYSICLQLSPIFSFPLFSLLPIPLNAVFFSVTILRTLLHFDRLFVLIFLFIIDYTLHNKLVSEVNMVFSNRPRIINPRENQNISKTHHKIYWSLIGEALKCKQIKSYQKCKFQTNQ